MHPKSSCIFLLCVFSAAEDQHGKDKGPEADQKGLCQELKDQVDTPGPYRLADTHFFSSFLRTRSGQVHEIDTGYQQHQHADNTEHPYVIDQASAGDPVPEFREQMPILHRLHDHFRPDRLVGVRGILLQQALHQRFDLGIRDILLQGDECLK
jgi:hypothetical protein